MIVGRLTAAIFTSGRWAGLESGPSAAETVDPDSGKSVNKFSSLKIIHFWISCFTFSVFNFWRIKALVITISQTRQFDLIRMRKILSGKVAARIARVWLLDVKPTSSNSYRA
jgi:hypothetical protein